MKKKVVNWIKIKGMGYNEIIIDISIEDIQFNSIELVEDEDGDQLILHKFIDDYDYEIDWNDLPKSWQKIIYYYLIPPLLN
jgi:hypothetical protein